MHNNECLPLEDMGKVLCMIDRQIDSLIVVCVWIYEMNNILVFVTFVVLLKYTIDKKRCFMIIN